MELAYIVLLILLIIYVPLYFYVRAGKLERYGLVKYGPCIMIRTKLGLRLMDRLAKYKRAWDAFGLLSKAITLLLMGFMLFIIIIDLTLIPQMMNTQPLNPVYVLAIPGLNPMMPLVYGAIGLVVAMTVHEMGHGIQSRTNGIEVDSSGLLYAVVPVGAFVEPNNEQLSKAPRKAQMNMFSAGIATNFVLAGVCFLVLSFGMLGTLSSEYGSNLATGEITDGSPADIAGIPDFSIFPDLNESLTFDPTVPMDLKYVAQDGEHTAIDMRLGLYVVLTTDNSPAGSDKAFFHNRFIYSIDLKDGGGQRLIDSQATFSDIMSRTHGGQTVEVFTLKVDGTDLHGKDVTLGSKGSIGYLGIQTNISGMGFTTPDHVLGGAVNPFYNANSVTDVGSKAISYIGGPFRGYAPIPEGMHWWYSDSDAFWIAATTVYWIFWLNLVLAIFNALPAIPFDGGYLFRGGVDWIADRFKLTGDKKEATVNMVTNGVSMFMIFAFMLIVMVMLI